MCHFLTQIRIKIYGRICPESGLPTLCSELRTKYPGTPGRDTHGPEPAGHKTK